jgi:hypothetical protein
MTHSDSRPIVLIAGATGNLGRSLGDALCSDYRIVGLDLKTEGTTLPFMRELRVDRHDDSGRGKQEHHEFHLRYPFLVTDGLALAQRRELLFRGLPLLASLGEKERESLRERIWFAHGVRIDRLRNSHSQALPQVFLGLDGAPEMRFVLHVAYRCHE